MIRLRSSLLGVCVVVLGAGTAHAQFWQPAPVVWPQPAPVIVSPSFPTVVSPVVVSQRPAMVVSPTPMTRVYRPPIIGYQPVQTTYTRRRPILGGTVTRYRYGFQRVAF